MVRQVIWERSFGRCELCERALTFDSMQGHHRRTRRVGPDCPCNALALCPSCHHERVHAHPEESRGEGWIVSKFDQPTGKAVQLPRGKVVLECDGSWRFAA
jgi:hypothetical protein